MTKNSKPTSEGAYGGGERTSRTDDLRIENVTPLPPPEHLIRFRTSRFAPPRIP